jgi:hypothetical protein
MAARRSASVRNRAEKLVRGFEANIWGPLTQVFATAKYFVQSRHPRLVEGHGNGAAVETGAAASVPPAADMNVDAQSGINAALPDQQEIERRRNLVRTFFNDFWSGVSDKPPAFVERLEEAEDYLNERIAANGEFCLVDAKTRVMLGLPPRSNSSVSADIDRHTIGK